MGIGVAIGLLTYVMVLVMTYVVIVYLKRGENIINRAYRHAYAILCFGMLIVIILIKLPHVTLDRHVTGYLLLSSKFISVLTLGISLFLLNRKKC
ncbi:hypothetical protein [Pseudoneobacillus sp. C159]